MAVLKERKFEEKRKFLIEPLNIAAANEVNGKKKLRLGFTLM